MNIPEENRFPSSADVRTVTTAACYRERRATASSAPSSPWRLYGPFLGRSCCNELAIASSLPCSPCSSMRVPLFFARWSAATCHPPWCSCSLPMSVPSPCTGNRGKVRAPGGERMPGRPLLTAVYHRVRPRFFQRVVGRSCRSSTTFCKSCTIFCDF